MIKNQQLKVQPIDFDNYFQVAANEIASPENTSDKTDSVKRKTTKYLFIIRLFKQAQ